MSLCLLPLPLPRVRGVSPPLHPRRHLYSLCTLHARLYPPQVVFPLSGYAPPKRYAVYLFGIYAAFMLCLVMAEAGALGNFLM